ncbi:MAG: DUF6044 family protein [Bdellovibrionales bacterium]
MNKSASLPFYLAGLFLLALYAYWLYWPIDQVLIQAHDFLDSIFLYFISRAGAEGFLFNPDYTFPALMDMPLNALAMRDLGLGELYYELFTPSGAVVANGIVTLLIGYTGFFILSRDYLLRRDKRTFWAFVVIVIMAFVFATLPFKQQRLSGVAMLPFLFWGALNLYHGRHKIISFLLFGFYPFVAFLHYNGFAVALAMIVGTGALVVKRHEKAPVFIGLTAFTGIIYCLLEYRSLLIALHPSYDIQSSRGIDQKAELPDIMSTEIWVELIKKMFLATGHHHMIVDLYFVSFLSYALLLALSIFVIICKKSWQFSYGASALNLRMIAGIFVIAGPVLGLINFFDTHFNILQNTIGIPLSLRRLDSFSLPLFFSGMTVVFLSLIPYENNRRFVLRTLFLTICMGLVVMATVTTNRYNRFRFKADLGLPKDFSTMQMVKSAFGKAQTSQNSQNIRSRKFIIHPMGSLMYTESEYFMPQLFKTIDSVLEQELGAKDNYKVLHVGLSPSIGQYHGYTAIDGYFYNYPRDFFYKNFWPVIAPEVKAQGQSKEDVFPGGRIYAPLAKGHFKDGVITPLYDWCAFTKIGGRVVFSGYNIGNAVSEGLKPLIENDNVFVYGVDPKSVCPLNQKL